MDGKIAYDLMLKIKGERVAGTENHRRTIKIIKQFLKDIKLDFKTLEFPLYISEIDKGYIFYGAKKIEGTPYGLTVPFSVEGELDYVESFEQINSVDKNLKEKIIIMAQRPGLSEFPSLKEKRIKGIITCSRTDELTSSLHLSDWMIKKDCIIPLIDIPYTDMLKLLDFKGKKVKIQGKGKTYKTKSENIIVQIKGRKNCNEKIVVMGHTDTVPGSPGASDNSGGTGIMAELIYHFYKNRVKRDIIFIFFSGEEWGLWGSRFYVARNEKSLKDIIVGINFDVAGDPFGTNHCIVTANDYLTSIVKFISRINDNPINVKKDIYSSDNMPFSLKGVPTINLFRAGGLPSRFVHTRKDSIEYINENGLVPLINFGKNFIQMVGDASLNPIERDIDDQIKKKIEEYFKGRGLSIEDVVENLKKIK